MYRASSVCVDGIVQKDSMRDQDCYLDRQGDGSGSGGAGASAAGSLHNSDILGFG